MKTAQEFKEAQFNVERYHYQDGITPELMNEVRNKLSPFQTEDFLEKQTKNRILILPLLVAWSQKSTLSLEELKFEPISQDKERKIINLSYTGTLVLDEEGEKINLSGVMSLKNTNKSWKVTYDNFNAKDLFNLAMERK